MFSNETKQSAFWKKILNAKIVSIKTADPGSPHDGSHVIKLDTGLSIIAAIVPVAGQPPRASFIFQDEALLENTKIKSDELLGSTTPSAPSDTGGFIAPVRTKRKYTKRAAKFFVNKPANNEPTQSSLFDDAAKATKTSEKGRWLGTKQAAKYLGVAKGSLLNMVYQGRISRHKFGRLNRFDRNELRDLVHKDPPIKK